MLLFYPYKMERTYYSLESVKNFYAHENKAKLNSLVLGDSTMAFGVRAKMLNNSYSLALPSSTNINVWIELNRFLKNNPPPKCIIYSTSYIKDFYYKGFLSKHISAQFYDWKELQDIYYDSQKDKILPSVESNYLSYFLKVFSKKYLDFTSYTQIRLKRVILPSSEDVSSFNENVKETILEKGHLKSLKLGDNPMSERQDYLLKAFEVLPSDDRYFEYILEKTQREKIKFIFVEMPILNKTKNSKVENFNQKHALHIQQILSKYANTKFIKPDYIKNELDFFDANHLNSKGSMIFTDLLSKKILTECE